MWLCARWRKDGDIVCGGSVKQVRNDFIQVKDHKCKPIANVEFKLRIEALAVTIGIDKKFENSAKIASAVIQEFFNRGLILYPRIRQLKRSIDAQRKKSRPPNPTDLWFDIDMDFIPENFLKGEVIARYKKLPKRHLIFATDRQKDLLGIAKRWYLDLTYRMVDNPFVQILVIRTMVSHKKTCKQIHVAFVLMSRTTTKDFKCVFKKLVEILEQEVYVEEIVCDYQINLWKAAKKSFPYASITGCGFHWFHDVWRALKRCGLIYLFRNNKEVEKVCSRLLNLYLLPSNKILKIFSKLKEKASKLDLGDQSSLLTGLFSHVETTWINSPIWSIDTWALFGEPFRSPLQDQWSCISFRCVKRFPFYRLVALLFEETQLVPSCDGVPLCRESLLELYARSKTTLKYMYLVVGYFRDYENGAFNSLKFLKLCAAICVDPATLFFAFGGSLRSRIMTIPNFDDNKLVNSNFDCP